MSDPRAKASDRDTGPQTESLHSQMEVSNRSCLGCEWDDVIDSTLPHCYEQSLAQHIEQQGSGVARSYRLFTPMRTEGIIREFFGVSNEIASEGMSVFTTHPGMLAHEKINL